jgi:GT2 family glycosyltransferase
LNPDGTSQGNARKFPSLGALFQRRFSGRSESLNETKLLSEPIVLDWAHGSFLAFRREFFMKKLEGFDEHFFLFFEDTDICRRSLELGKRILQLPQATILHSSERLSGGNFLVAVFKKTFWIHVASAFKYFWKYRGKKLPKTTE